jgi:Lrp/AsnC family transcriptional regulator, regulator for asnA, asnC and gidA
MTQANLNANVLLDEIDHRIINLLRLDGRMSFSEISKRLEMPEATARYRVQRLLQSEIVQILAFPNPEKLGTPHLLIVFLMVEMNHIDEIAHKLEKMEEVRFVAVTSGRYHLIVDIFFGAHSELITFFDKLKQISGIVGYESQLVLKLLKAEYKYTLT